MDKMTLVCSCCGEELPVKEFYKRKSKYRNYSYNCKRCTKEMYQEKKQQRKQYYQENKEARKAYQIEYNKEHYDPQKEAIRNAKKREDREQFNRYHRNYSKRKRLEKSGQSW